MAEWHRRLIAESRALQGLAPTIADDPVGIELAARFLTSALTPSSHGPAAVVEEGANGAAGPRDNRCANDTGSARAATVGRSGLSRPAAPTTNAASLAATSEATDNAAR